MSIPNRTTTLPEREHEHDDLSKAIDALERDGEDFFQHLSKTSWLPTKELVLSRARLYRSLENVKHLLAQTGASDFDELQQDIAKGMKAEAELAGESVEGAEIQAKVAKIDDYEVFLRKQEGRRIAMKLGADEALRNFHRSVQPVTK